MLLNTQSHFKQMRITIANIIHVHLLGIPLHRHLYLRAFWAPFSLQPCCWPFHLFYLCSKQGQHSEDLVDISPVIVINIFIFWEESMWIRMNGPGQCHLNVRGLELRGHRRLRGLKRMRKQQRGSRMNGTIHSSFLFIPLLVFLWHHNV